MRWCDDLFVMHGVSMFEGHPQWRWNPEKGRLISDQVSDEMRNSIEFIRYFIQEGLMDKVMPIQSRTDWAAKVNGNRVGHYFHLVRTMDKYSAFMADDPKATWVYLPLPRVPGVSKQRNYLIMGDFPEFMITKMAKDPVKIMEWFNWCFSEEGKSEVKFS